MQDVKGLLKNVEENIPLARYTSFKIGGPARFFYAAKSKEDLEMALKVVKEAQIAYYILGNGTNILVSDKGFDGLVIKIQDTSFKIEDDSVIAGAGVSLGKAVNGSVKAGLAGLEWLVGIPGSIGGAICGNAGAFGHSIGEKVESVEVLDPNDLSKRQMSRGDCRFSYRESIFKEAKFVILEVRLKLEKGKKEESDNLTRDYIKKRSHHPVGFPSAGSVFKNPIIEKNQKVFEDLVKKYPEAEKFRTNGKIPAGWLIEEYGLLGKKIGGAMISKEHGNFIVNVGGAKATDVVMLISLIKQKIRVNFGIQLEEEIRYVGF